MYQKSNFRRIEVMKKWLILFMVCFLTACTASPLQQDDVTQDENSSEVRKDDVSEVKENDEKKDSSGKTRSEWIQYIKDSGVFDEYCTNKSVITFDVYEGKYEIKAQPKDWPTISVSQNKDGTFSSTRMYILEREFTYVKKEINKCAELMMTVWLNYHGEDVAECRLYVPQGDDQYYHFYYEPNKKYIYLNGKGDPMKFTSDLQNKILEHCESMMSIAMDTDSKSHELMADILTEKGLAPIVWKDAEAFQEPRFDLEECEGIYPMLRRYSDDMVYSVAENLYVVEKDGLYGVIDQNWNLIVDYISWYAPVLDDDHIHVGTAGTKSLNEKIAGTSYLLCTFEHGISGFGYVGDLEKWELKEYRSPDAGPKYTETANLGWMDNYVGVYEEGSHFEFHEDYDVEFFSTTGRYGVFNIYGLVSDAIYTDALLTAGKYVPVANEAGLWGYVDINGETVIPFEYEACMPYGTKLSAFPVINDMIILKDANTGLYGAVDLQGNIVANFVFEILGVVNNELVGKENGIWGTQTENGWVVYNG